MTYEEAIKYLIAPIATSTEPSAEYLKQKEAYDLAVQALETGEIYITGEDYNLYMQGYKAGKKDFEPNHGAWIVTAEDNDGVHRICCPFCSYEKGSNNTDPIIVTFSNFPKFCENCGADMRGGAV